MSPVQCKDHTGKTFVSKAEMCNHWGVHPNTFDTRIKAGWSLEDALTKAADERLIGQEHVGIRKVMNCGVGATVIEYNTPTDIKIQFDDGIIVSCIYGNFVNGEVAHPTLKATFEGEKSSLGTFKARYIMRGPDERVLYECECTKCNLGTVMLAPEQMIKHIKECHPETLKE